MAGGDEGVDEEADGSADEEANGGGDDEDLCFHGGRRVKSEQ